MLEPRLLEHALAAVPVASWPHWVNYDNDFERKRTTRQIDILPPPLRFLFDKTNSREWLAELKAAIGFPEPSLRGDGTLHGGGIHCVDRGGMLQTHLDYEIHPNGLERRLNLVLFLNLVWHDDWGGALRFFADDGSTEIDRVMPAFGRMAIWESGPLAYHGTGNVWCPEGVSRIAAAVYYLAEPRPGATRKRALFVPVRS